jgi:ankyrin repeat protein
VLLEHGADINALRNDDSTPLHISAQRGNVEVARMLLEHGASTSVKNKFGKTPLRVARSSDVIELLSKHGTK